MHVRIHIGYTKNFWLWLLTKIVLKWPWTFAAYYREHALLPDWRNYMFRTRTYVALVIRTLTGTRCGCWRRCRYGSTALPLPPPPTIVFVTAADTAAAIGDDDDDDDDQKLVRESVCGGKRFFKRIAEREILENVEISPLAVRFSFPFFSRNFHDNRTSSYYNLRRY